MRKCTGNNTHEWGFDAIFDVTCRNCGKAVEFFKDEIVRIGSRQIKKMVQRKFGIELEIEGKDLLTITREAQEIVYN